MVGMAAQQSNFVGRTPSPLDVKAMRTLGLKFPAGSRSNWHSHPAGQLLWWKKAMPPRRNTTARSSK